MQAAKPNSVLHRFAIFVAVSALALIAIGGLVTSHGVGMAVPDWPTSYGYNMFTLPFSIWLTGGVFHEHTHRQLASIVGVLVVMLTRWLGGRKSRGPLIGIGVAELAGGFAMHLLGEEWKGAGYFLSGIGGVVLLAGIAWFRNEPAARPLPTMGWAAFWLVQLQGLLGGLRVVLDAHVFAGTKLGVVFGIFHGCLAQVFFVLLCAIGLMTNGWWLRKSAGTDSDRLVERGGNVSTGTHWLLLGTTALIFLQLILGATMRHQHAGLAISDFPLAHGKWWPDLDAAAIARYNAERSEVVAVDPITAAQVVLQMTHRLMAVTILVLVAVCCWRVFRAGGTESAVRRLSLGWLILIFVQAGLGAWTVWSNKAADVATLHVVSGALSLVVGALICIMTVHSTSVIAVAGKVWHERRPASGPDGLISGKNQA